MLDENHRFACDNQTQCANVWTVSPTIPGEYTLRARAEGVDNVRSEWVTISFRVRAGNATNTPTPAATSTPGATNTPVATNTPAATDTPVPAASPAP